MVINRYGKFAAQLCPVLAFAGLLSSTASAQLLDDILLHEKKDDVEIQIKLTDRVHYLRHFPEKQGQTLDIYYDLSPGATTGNVAEDNEKRQSPPSDSIPHFTVTSQLEYGVRELVIEFDREVRYSVRPNKDQRSFLITVKKMTPEELKRPVATEKLLDLPEIRKRPATAAATPEDQNNDKAEVLMEKGRGALQTGSYAAAIDAFNQLLQLPSNIYTQDAQEWVGVAREKIGQPDKARLEYELYLKLYSSGPGVARVKERLARMPAKAAETIKPPEALLKKATETTAYGSLSMYYYHGASSNDFTTTDVVTNQLTQSAFTATDQSSLMTNVDASERFRGDEFDNRLVFRDSFTKNYLDNQPSRNKLYNAYFELKNRISDYSGRIGRQSATGGGVMGRFDGISLGSGFMSKYRGNVVAGRLADTTSTIRTTQPVFYGASLDMTGSTEGGWSGSVYAINQTLEGIADRRAVGAELRYFEIKKTVFALFDYDTSYKAVNTALVQGTLNTESGTIYNFLVDHRKTPSLSTRNALNGAITTSLGVLMQGMTESALRELAKARTATANLVQVGATHPLDEKWQIGGDIKLSNVSSMPPSGTSDVQGILPFTPGTGNEWTFTGQLIGSNILTGRDISVFGLNRITSDLINAHSLFVSNRSMVSRWTYDTSLRLYRQNNFGMATTRTTPSIKVSYLAKDRINIEVEGSLERTNVSGNGTSSRTTRKFFSLGFRSDF